MQAAGLHPREDERLAALVRLGLLDTPPEERFDRIIRLAATLLDTPIALLSLVDRDRQWFKSAIGLDDAETDRDVSFCAHAIVDPDHATMVVPDAADDVRFADNPYVTGDPNIRFYAGNVVHSRDGMPVGTLCVIDRQPRQFSAAQQQALEDLGALIEIELAREEHDHLMVQLDESERTKASILQSLNEGVVLQGPSGEIIEWNAAADDLLGISAERYQEREASGVQSRVIHPDGTDWPRDEHPSSVALRTRMVVRDQLMGLERDDGELIWLRVTAQPTFGPGGEHRVLSVFIDVTAQHNLEQELAVNEAASRSSLDALEQGVVLIGADGRIHRINPAAISILGYQPDELAAAFADGSLVARDEDGREVTTRRRHIEAGLEGEQLGTQVVGWKRPDGEIITLRVSYVPGADGNDGLLIAFTDVTEERRMMNDVARFQHLFQHANDIITIIDASGNVLYSSPSRGRVLGYPDDWTHPHGILGLVHPDDLPSALAELQLLIADRRGPEPFTLRVKAFTGEWRYVECVGTNLLHEPAVRGVVLTSRDTTDRVQLTEQLAYLAEHDPLTDLPNRSVLEPRLAQALARTKRVGAQVGVCFIDLDGFKQVNDNHGHAVGDDVIIEVADRIRTMVRGGDTAVRVGGDEFVVILDPVDGEAGALDAAERIRDAITDPAITRGAQIVGASVGVAVSEPAELPSDLLARADKALYEAKERRSSMVVLARPTTPHPTRT